MVVHSHIAYGSSCPLTPFSFLFIFSTSLFLSLFLSFSLSLIHHFPREDPALMMSQDKGRPLPKFGEWDVNNPASADGFTVIFAKARDEKKATGTAAGGSAGQKNFDDASQAYDGQHSPTTTKKWFCCF